MLGQSKCSAMMAPVGGGYNEAERCRVTKTLLDPGVERRAPPNMVQLEQLSRHEVWATIDDVAPFWESYRKRY